MLPHRKLLLILSVVLVGGSLALTGGYAIRLRSDAFRREMIDDLSRFFELPCDLGRIRGRTFSSRSFEDVTIWLPDRRDRVFSCRRAIWEEDEAGDEKSNELTLIDGTLVLGTDRWVRSDYRQVLESGLRHDFNDLNLTRVTLEGFEIFFDKGDLEIRCRETSGTIDMTNPEDGVARLHAYELNGYRISEGVRIHARFSPKDGVKVGELVLTLPPVPLRVAGLERVLGHPVRHGTFAGSVEYRQAGQFPETWIRGDLSNADLAELSSALPFGPLEGRFSVNVSGARVVDGVVTHLSGHGAVSDLALSPLAALVGQSNLAGQASLTIGDVDLALGHVRRLRVSGEVRGISLADWLRPLGRGSATGMLEVRINNLDIVDDRIRSADIEATCVPPSDTPGTLDRELILSLAQEVLNVHWPAMVPERLLPDQVEYARLGVRFLVKDNQLRVLGTHGRANDTILTIMLFGEEFGVVREPSRQFDLTEAIAKALERIRKYDAEGVKRWLKSAREKGAGTAHPTHKP